MLSDIERRDWLRLIRSENVGPITFNRLMARFGSAGKALEALPDLASKGGAAKKPRIPTIAEAEQEIDALTRMGARLLASCEADYPRPLAAIDDAPPVIAAGHNVHLLNRRCLAIVGARNASLNGRRFAETLAQDLARSGYVIVSGLARGIDTAAHQATLQTGTIAVVAGGIDIIYPPENAELQKRIFATGAIVSEMSPGMTPTQRLFPRRNRIIAGLSLGTIIVEASQNSGSLITANLALEQGREVFAVPGSPLDPRATGPNNLIKTGAHLITGAEDVLNIIGDINTPMQEPPSPAFAGLSASALDEKDLAEVRADIMERLSPSPTEVDELVRDCHFSPALVQAALLELELAGRIERQPGNKVSRL